MADEPVVDSPAPGGELRVPWATLVKIGAALVLSQAVVTLWPLALSLLLAGLLATSLHPLLARLARWMPRGVAVLVISLLLIGAVLFVLLMVVPPVVAQGAAVFADLPALRDHLVHALPVGMPREALARLLDSPTATDPLPIIKHALSWGQLALSGLVEVGVVVVLAIYLLLDGERVLRWLIAFAPIKHRAKVHLTLMEMAPVVFAYVAGNVVTSLVCGVYSFIALSLLHVPAALLLAVLTGIFDILPVAGFVLSAVPATVLAATVSPTTALTVLLLYILYHLLENYLLIPAVYGNRLRLSTLTVLVSLLAAFLIAGVAGAIAVLPLVASYPIIERHWLAGWLRRETLQTHAELTRENG